MSLDTGLEVSHCVRILISHKMLLLVYISVQSGMKPKLSYVVYGNLYIY